MKDYDIKHTTSRPYHPQANGQAERTVQTVKRLLVKAKEPYKALLDYRNSPLNTGFSPAQLFLGRRRKQYRRNRKMLRPIVVASRDSDLPVTVPPQSETECVANQTSGQTPSQSDDNSQMVRKENVKTRSGRVVKIPARFRDDDA